MLLRLAAGCYRRRDATDSSPTLNSPQRKRGPPLGPRGATVAGLAFAVAGLFPSLAGLGLIPARFSPGVPPWVVIAAGSMFILAGISVVNNYAFGGGVQPDGDLGPEASFAVRLVSYLLSLAIAGLMCAVFAWTAFGPGERHFSSWGAFAGRQLPVQSSERAGRIAFGICAGLLAVFLVLSAFSGAKRLRIAWRSARRPGGGSEAGSAYVTALDVSSAPEGKE
jgi:hypothetical protein